MQDQTLQLISTENGRDRRVGVAITDRPDQPLDIAAGFRIRDLPAGAARDAAIAQAGGGRAQRAWLWRTEDGKVALILSDPQGRPRLTLGVGSDGEPGVELLDAAGKIQQRLR